jgi:hypothetical protein
MEYARAHDIAIVALVQEEIGRITPEGNRRQRELTVGQILRLNNDPERLRRDYGIYMHSPGSARATATSGPTCSRSGTTATSASSPTCSARWRLGTA